MWSVVTGDVRRKKNGAKVVKQSDGSGIEKTFQDSEGQVEEPSNGLKGSSFR